MKVLGIETSCDETSAAVVENGTKVLSCMIASSKADFQSLGGVVPENAARAQLETILPTISRALEEANITVSDLDAIAVTNGPGLLGSLLIGTTTARVLSHLSQKPLIPVHHVLGHLDSTWLEQDENPHFPTLTLSVSGGHTDLWYRESHTKNRRLATTIDDAAGEAFDKGAMMLGLPYPGGPALSKLADSGDSTFHTFPLPKVEEFSFSGLKTSLKYCIRDKGGLDALSTDERASIAASYQDAIVRQLVRGAKKALEKYSDTKELHIVGGVSANTTLRSEMNILAREFSLHLRVPSSMRYCTDNAAMIAASAYFLLQEQPTVATKAWQTSTHCLVPSYSYEV